MKGRFHANEREIIRCLNFKELVPYLCERAALLSFEEGQSLLKCDRAELLFQKMKEKDLTSYSTFLGCLQREESHLGHAYIRALLEGRLKQYASKSDIAHSKALKKVVKNRLVKFVKGINLTELLPHMFQRQLLTEHEREYICDTRHSTSERIIFLFNALDTKGPLAYGLFANCLEDEDCHVTHNELFKMMCTDLEIQNPHSRKRSCFPCERSTLEIVHWKRFSHID